MLCTLHIFNIVIRIQKNKAHCLNLVTYILINWITTYSDLLIVDTSSEGINYRYT